MRRGAVQPGIPVVHPARRQVAFQPDDGFDARFFRLLEELDHAEHGAVVGDGDGGHAHFLGPVDQLGYLAESIQQGILGVQVEVDEGVGHIYG